MTTVRLENVTKTIKGSTVIRETSLSLTPGRCYGLKGVNGSGKAMLMQLIAGLIRPSSGAVYIDERRLGKELDFPPSIGLLIENPAFLDYLSGYENLVFLAGIRGTASAQRIRETIRRVGLDPEDRKSYGKYSLGMKQRLGIAAAIMEEPELVLLDAPTNALDSDGVELVVEIVSELKAQGTLVVVSCHDYEVLKLMADEIYSVREGEVFPGVR